MRLDKPRVLRQRGVNAVQGGIQPIQFFEYSSTIRMSFGICWIERNGTVIARQGVIPAPHFLEHVAPIRPSHRVVALERESAIETRERGLPLLEFRQDGRQVAVRR